MKDWIRSFLLLALTMATLHAVAVEVPHDTIYFYKTWEQMLYFEPSALIIDPIIDAVTPYEVYVETGSDEINKNIEKEYISLSQGDSIWLINSDYLKKNFQGDVKGLDGFIPVFFNDRVAFITGNGPLKLKDVIFGTNIDGVTSYTQAYYYIDFLNLQVNRLTHSYLSELLEKYHDLQMRYEGMKDYKKSYMIEEFFYKFIDRATEDPMQPYILDLMK